MEHDHTNLHPKKRCLIVDDDELACNVGAAHMEEFGFEIEIAHDGRKAIELCKKSHFDCILLDYQMPTGAPTVIEEISHFTSEEEYPAVLICTSFDSKDFKHALPEDKYSGIFTKPYDYNDIKIILEEEGVL